MSNVQSLPSGDLQSSQRLQAIVGTTGSCRWLRNMLTRWYQAWREGWNWSRLKSNPHRILGVYFRGSASRVQRRTELLDFICHRRDGWYGWCYQARNRNNGIGRMKNLVQFSFNFIRIELVHFYVIEGSNFGILSKGQSVVPPIKDSLSSQ